MRTASLIIIATNQQFNCTVCNILKQQLATIDYDIQASLQLDTFSIDSDAVRRFLSVFLFHQDFVFIISTDVASVLTLLDKKNATQIVTNPTIVHQWQRVFILQFNDELLNSLPELLLEKLKRYNNDHVYQAYAEIEVTDTATSNLLVPLLTTAILDQDIHRPASSDAKQICIPTKSSAKSVSELWQLIKHGAHHLHGAIKYNLDLGFLVQLTETNDPLVLDACRVIEETFNEYGPSNVFISFNGGKDCTVLLFLVLAVLHTKFSNHTDRLLGFYVHFEAKRSFEEQQDFVDMCAHLLNHSLELYTCRESMRSGLTTLLTQKPHLRACFMGTRRTDPGSRHMSIMQHTDDDWPPLMRVCPLLEWSYAQIWDCLLLHGLPYCSLYDRGYTSLGARENTHPNSKLCYEDENGMKRYVPAYRLSDETDERCGRERPSL